MNYKISDFFLRFKTPFSIAHGTRNGTDIVILEIEADGIKAYGEASLPPYLSETKESVAEFIREFFNTYTQPLVSLHETIRRLHADEKSNTAAKACIEIALYNWFSARAGVPLWKFLGLNKEPLPPCTFTIGMGNRSEIIRNVKSASDFHILKIKLGGDHDREIIDTVREITGKPICADVNQGWKSPGQALEMIHWLSGKNVLFVEQPLNKNDLEGQQWLYKISPLPIYADESVQTPSDVTPLKGIFHGINIKLMKCGGISRALMMAGTARKNGMKVMIGSMSETGCAIMAAAHLSSLADITDLDGPLLTENNPFDIVKYENGKIALDQS